VDELAQLRVAVAAVDERDSLSPRVSCPSIVSS
jgi:hypothetical protein